MNTATFALLPLAAVGMLGCDLASLERALPTSNSDMAAPFSSASVDLSVAVDMASPSKPIDMAAQKPIDMASHTPSPDMSQSLATGSCPDPLGCEMPKIADWSFYENAGCLGQEYAEKDDREYYPAHTWDGRGLIGNTTITVTTSYYRNQSGACLSLGWPEGSASMTGPMAKVYRAQADTGCNCPLCTTCVAGQCVTVDGSDGVRCSNYSCASPILSQRDVCNAGVCVPNVVDDCSLGLLGRCGTDGECAYGT